MIVLYFLHALHSKDIPGYWFTKHLSFVSLHLYMSWVHCAQVRSVGLKRKIYISICIFDRDWHVDAEGPEPVDGLQCVGFTYIHE